MKLNSYREQTGDIPMPAPILKEKIYAPEPTIQIKLKRTSENTNYKTILDTSSDSSTSPCDHPCIEKWVCKSCGRKYTRFNTFLDSGTLVKSIDIFYVSDPEYQNNCIYRGYRPKNSQYMREYLCTLAAEHKLFMWSKRLSLEDLNEEGQKWNRPRSKSHSNAGTPLNKNLDRASCAKLNLINPDSAYLHPSKEIDNSTQSQRPNTNILNISKEVHLDSKNLEVPKSKRLQNYISRIHERHSILNPKFNNKILSFNGNLESGNLWEVEMVHPNYYLLSMSVDTNTKGHQQWFYYSVSNTHKYRTVRFEINNFSKGYSPFQQGMQVNVYSKTNKELTGIGWTLGGMFINYTRNELERDNWKTPAPINLPEEEEEGILGSGIGGRGAASPKRRMGMGFNASSTMIAGPAMNQTNKQKKKYYYTLSFQYTFLHDDDTVYFAFAKPYTYSEILYRLSLAEGNLESKSENIAIEHKSQIYTKSNIPESGNLMNNIKLKVSKRAEFPPGSNFEYKKESTFTMENYDMKRSGISYSRGLLSYTLAGFPSYYIQITSSAPESTQKRKVIIISARVHPGETNSSLIFEGVLDFMLSDDVAARFVRDKYIIFMIPCLNPDGVGVGNYRSSLAGVDLNRVWHNPNKLFHPLIFAAKQIILKLSKTREILIFCDLHCHSKKFNSFTYGCNQAPNEGFSSWTKVRLLPRIMGHFTHLFSYKDCRFKIQPERLGTSRLVLWKEFNVTTSFTLECSFHGYEIHQEEIIPFKIREYLFLGHMLGYSVGEYKRMLSQIQQEIALCNGWLKPYKLWEYTGGMKADDIAKENLALQALQRRKELGGGGKRKLVGSKPLDKLADGNPNLQTNLHTVPQQHIIKKKVLIVARKSGGGVGVGLGGRIGVKKGILKNAGAQFKKDDNIYTPEASDAVTGSTKGNINTDEYLQYTLQIVFIQRFIRLYIAKKLQASEQLKLSRYTHLPDNSTEDNLHESTQKMSSSGKILNINMPSPFHKRRNSIVEMNKSEIEKIIPGEIRMKDKQGEYNSTFYNSGNRESNSKIQKGKHSNSSMDIAIKKPITNPNKEYIEDESPNLLNWRDYFQPCELKEAFDRYYRIDKKKIEEENNPSPPKHKQTIAFMRKVSDDHNTLNTNRSLTVAHNSPPKRPRVIQKNIVKLEKVENPQSDSDSAPDEDNLDKEEIKSAYDSRINTPQNIQSCGGSSIVSTESLRECKRTVRGERKADKEASLEIEKVSLLKTPSSPSLSPLLSPKKGDMSLIPRSPVTASNRKMVVWGGKDKRPHRHHTAHRSKPTKQDKDKDKDHSVNIIQVPDSAPMDKEIRKPVIIKKLKPLKSSPIHKPQEDEIEDGELTVVGRRKQSLFQQYILTKNTDSEFIDSIALPSKNAEKYKDIRAQRERNLSAYRHFEHLHEAISKPKLAKTNNNKSSKKLLHSTSPQHHRTPHLLGDILGRHCKKLHKLEEEISFVRREKDSFLLNIGSLNKPSEKSTCRESKMVENVSGSMIESTKVKRNPSESSLIPVPNTNKDLSTITGEGEIIGKEGIIVSVRSKSQLCNPSRNKYLCMGNTEQPKQSILSLNNPPNNIVNNILLSNPQGLPTTYTMGASIINNNNINPPILPHISTHINPPLGSGANIIAQKYTRGIKALNNQNPPNEELGDILLVNRRKGVLGGNLKSSMGVSSSILYRGSNIQISRPNEVDSKFPDADKGLYEHEQREQREQREQHEQHGQHGQHSLLFPAYPPLHRGTHPIPLGSRNISMLAASSNPQGRQMQIKNMRVIHTRMAQFSKLVYGLGKNNINNNTSGVLPKLGRNNNSNNNKQQQQQQQQQFKAFI